MRLLPLIALATFLPVVSTLAQTTQQTAPPKPVKTPTSLPPVRAEPDNAGNYGAPVPDNPIVHTDADVGPVQKKFVRASQLDHLGESPDADDAWDNAALLANHEKVALDKKITIPLIHDVQNDGVVAAQDNTVLQYEIDYLNWGAVTGQQLNARRGHYFTITWDNDGPKADFVAQFDYRETRTKEVVRTLSQKMPGVAGAVRSYFAVVGTAYLAYGPVVSWRFTIHKGDTIVAEAKSFIW
jgi:hypothetical protein